MLAIEVDGYTHTFEEVADRDEKKEQRLRELGVRVIRFRDEDVMNNMEGVMEEIEVRSRGGKGNIARLVAIYIMQRYAGISNEEIGKLFGGIHYIAVSKASARLKEKMASDKKLSKLVNDVANSHVKT